MTGVTLSSVNSTAADADCVPTMCLIRALPAVSHRNLTPCPARSPSLGAQEEEAGGEKWVGLREALQVEWTSPGG